MNRQATRQNGFVTAINFLVLLYHSTVRDIRKANGNALIALVMEVMQTVIMIGIFYTFVTILGRPSLISGSFLMFIMSGVFLFMTHVKTMGKVASTNAANSQLLIHAPVSSLLLIGTAAFATLYIQVLSIGVILLVVQVFIEPVAIHSPKGFALCFFLSWFTGIGMGVLFMSITAFLPKSFSIVSTVYQRANMIFSGKMLLASKMGSALLPFFIWNPLFHLIDQSRIAVFLNYESNATNLTYPIWFGIISLLIGFMLEHYARKYVSISANARR
jgi:ABC-type polysaccharide/polyol phosphate export permease